MQPCVNVLYEDNHLLVVDKPAGMPTMGAEPGVPTLHQWAADYLKHRYHKPGNVFVGIVSRLDRGTTGVIVLARTSKSAARLSIQFGGPGKSKKVSTTAGKIYLAIVAGDLRGDANFSAAGELHDSLWKDEAACRMRVDQRSRPDSQSALLRYQVLDRTVSFSLVAVRLLSGRKHQIRVQFAERGHPVLGDAKYGSQCSFPGGLALHSWQLCIAHPTTEQRLHFRAAIPPVWREVWPTLSDDLLLEPKLMDHLAL